MHSGITTAEQLYISAVIHRANLGVDEPGTAASAAMAVVLGTTSMPVDQVTFQVDHPFLFALRDTKTGADISSERLPKEPLRCCPGEPSAETEASATRQGHLSRRLHRLP